MTHIQWTSNLNTDIPVIDKQHYRIVEYINELYEVSETHDRGAVGQVLKELIDYTLSHFAFEESLMTDAGYLMIAGHKRVHEIFTHRINGFVQRFNKGEEVAEELLGVLTGWLINHIQSDDNDYASVVREKMNLVAKESGWLARSMKKFFSYRGAA